MKRFTKHIIVTVAVFLLIGCQSNPSMQQIEQTKVTGFTPFGVTGGYDVGSLIDYANESYSTLFTSEYIEQNAKPEAQKSLHKLFHAPLQPVSPRYNENQKKQFMDAIRHSLLTGHFNLSDSAKAAIYRIYKIDIEVASATKKATAKPEELQYRLIEALPARGGIIIGIKAKTGMARKAVAVTSILAFNKATVTIYFDRSVGAAERMEIFDKIHFDDRVTIRLGSQTDNSIRVEYREPTIVAFKGVLFDKQSLRFYIKNGRLPTPDESLALSTAKHLQTQKREEKAKAAADRRKQSAGNSDTSRPAMRY